MLEFARCMRDAGIDVPDPRRDEEPILIGPDLGIDPSDPAFAAANEQCAEHLPRVGPGGVDAGASPEAQERFLKMAACMRGSGFDVPDPDFSGGATRMSLPDGVDPTDPGFQAAQRACRTTAGLSEPGASRCETRRPPDHDHAWRHHRRLRDDRRLPIFWRTPP